MEHTTNSDLTIQFLIRRMAGISPNVHLYVANQLWWKELEDKELFSERYVLDRCLEMLLEEFKDLGIELLMEEERVSQNLVYINELVELRTRIDKDNLKAFLIHLSEKHYKDIVDQITNIDSGDTFRAVYLLINFMFQRYPFGSGLNSLNDDIAYLVTSNELFVEHVYAISLSVDDDRQELFISDDNFVIASKYITQMALASNRFRHALSIFKNSGNLKCPEGVDQLVLVHIRAGNENVNNLQYGELVGGAYEAFDFHPKFYKKRNTDVKYMPVVVAFVYAYVALAEVGSTIERFVNYFGYTQEDVDAMLPLVALLDESTEVPKEIV